MIYAWQVAWLIYGISTIFRKTSYGYLYVAPGHMHPSIYMVFSLNLLANIAWLLLWDRMLPAYALIMLVLSMITLYVCLGISYRRLHARGNVLKREEHMNDVWLVRILVQNGLAIYATWVTIATLLNLCVVMAYVGTVSQHVASTVCLSILLLLIVVWFFLDNFLWDVYVRYTVTPYFVFVFALIGTLVAHWNVDGSNSALTAFMLATSCAGAVAKCAIMLLRHIRHPIFLDSIFASQPDYGSSARDKLLFTEDKDIY